MKKKEIIVFFFFILLQFDGVFIQPPKQPANFLNNRYDLRGQLTRYQDCSLSVYARPSRKRWDDIL